MKRFKLLTATLISLSYTAFCQNEWNSTTSSTVPMFRDGFVGIGTGANPTQLLVVQDPTSGNGTKVLFGTNSFLGSFGTGGSALQITCPSTSDGSYLHLTSGNGSTRSEFVIGTNPFGSCFYSGKGSTGTTRPIIFYTHGTAGMTEKLKIDIDGKVSIGLPTSTPGTYKLYVKDGILTEKVKVAIDATANWSDYVFAKGYKLKPLNELDAFIKKNKHLPGVPSAEEMVKEGLDVATMDAKLLEKIEELTLYVIELKKEVEKLKKDQNTLK